MKKFFALSTVVLMLCVAMTTTSCVSVSKAFEKNGYEMTELTPMQQGGLASFLSAFPAYGQVSKGHLVKGNTITFVFDEDAQAWENYCYSLTNAGFSKMATGYVRADKSTGNTYNVASNVTEVLGKQLRLITFSAVAF